MVSHDVVDLSDGHRPVPSGDVLPVVSRSGRRLGRAGGCYRGPVALAALVISVLALLVSGFAYWRQVKWARIAGRAEVRIAAIEGERPTTALLERMRAALSVEFEPVGTDGHMIVVRNEGPATAHGVTIDLAPRAAPPGRRWPLRSGVAPELLNSPFPATISPRARAAARLKENLATVTQLRGTLKWTDGEGAHEEHLDLSIR
jgi:hypothetical protein